MRKRALLGVTPWVPSFCASVWRAGFWFRIFGYGLAVRREADFGLSYSERNGYARAFRVFGWIVKPLDPSSWRGV